MATFTVIVDRSLCGGFGACVAHAEGVFELDARGLVTARVLETDDPAVHAAAAACPMGALAVQVRGEQAA